jgi:putative hydrolase of the HAD superfamily
LLIIFDLDDTLIDTSGCITPIKLEQALCKMKEAGLRMGNFQEALETLRRLDSTAPSARCALEEFIEINGIDRSFLSIGIEEVYNSLPEDIPVFPLEDAVDLLSELYEIHKLALVTVGRREQQLFKLKKAGIDSSFFSKIVISEDRNKKEHYQMLMREFDVFPREVVVCGDRVPVDLAPAKQLGCTTIHMKWGRGVHSKGKKDEVDFSISRLAEIRSILSNISISIF